MNTSRFLEIETKLPFAGDISYWEGFISVGNEYVLRETHHVEDFHALNDQLQKLETGGVKVIDRYPLLAADGSLFIVSPRLHGTTLDEWTQNTPDPLRNSVVTKLACSLADYFVIQLNSTERYHLGDVVSPFQYMVVDTEPILIDIDTSTGDGMVKKWNTERRNRYLGSFLVDIGAEYGNLISPEGAHLLHKLLDRKFKAVTGESIFIDNDSMEGLDEDKYGDFR